jgi:hypothetical protein
MALHGCAADALSWWRIGFTPAWRKRIASLLVPIIAYGHRARGTEPQISLPIKPS